MLFFHNKCKKIIILFALAICLTGCTDGSDAPKLLREWSGEREADETQVQSSERVVRVGMMTDMGGIEDQGFNQSAWEGLASFAEKTGSAVDYAEPFKAEDFEPTLSTLAENGYNLCWGIGFQCSDAILKVAEQYPDVNFAIIDSEYESSPDNVTSVVFRAQEPSFVVGYIAARVSKTGKVGFVGGMVGETIDQFQYGYMAGVFYANRTYNTDVQVAVEYVGDFVDSDRGGAIADEMYDSGCDVIYTAAGGAGLGVIESAGRHDKFVIGVDKDQSYLDPVHVLTSGIKKVDVAVMRVSEDYVQGIPIGGKTLSFGMTEGAVGIPEGHANFADNIYDEALTLCDRIKAGEIVPPSNEDQYIEYESAN